VETQNTFTNSKFETKSAARKTTISPFELHFVVHHSQLQVWYLKVDRLKCFCLNRSLGTRSSGCSSLVTSFIGC